MSLVEILGMLGCSTAIGGTIGFFIQRSVKKRDEARDREQQVLQRQQNKLEEQNKATMLGVQALLRDRLLQGFRHYIQQGFAGYDDRKNLENMYTQYEKLGPNSVMDDLYHKFCELPESL